MGFYEDRVFPRLMNARMDNDDARRTREEVCASLTGDVLELGFGTGLNLPHLPPAVTRVRAVDPMERARELAAERIAATPVDVEFVGLNGQDIPVASASADAALSTWTLCSIPDPVAAIREVRRVLRPGGPFCFVEHGVSPDRNVQRWQKRLNPIQRRLSCGCHLDRDIPALLEAGGMRVQQLETYYTKREPKIMGWNFQGIAVPAG